LCAPTGIYEIDYRTASFKSVNDAMCQILGYTREELFSIGPSGLLDDNSRARFTDRMRRGRRKPASSLFNTFWTPVFTGVTELPSFAIGSV
jgi:PAS domain S-box-containing protein